MSLSARFGTLPANMSASGGMVLHKQTEGRFLMFDSVSNVASQVSIGFAAFVISAVCILAAAGPVHLIG